VRRILIGVATGLVVIVVALDVISFTGWPDGGPIALAQVPAAHLTLLAFLIGIPVAFLGGTGWLRVSLLALLVVSLVRFGGDWWSLPASAPDGAARVKVASWNLQEGSRSPAESVAFIRALDARVVSLQELSPDVSAAIAADPVLAARFPFQALYPNTGVSGLGILSVDPLGDVRTEAEPPRLLASVASPAGRIRVLDAHISPPSFVRGPMGLPVSFDPSSRDAALGRVRDTMAADASGAPLLLLADLDTASTESAFGRFLGSIKGLRDSHAEVGYGPGWTWRPAPLEGLGTGLFRIDVAFTGAGLRPISTGTACPSAGDHCAVLATVVADPG